jgi:selenocysteine lyase/cysteine desulfurase
MLSRAAPVAAAIDFGALRRREFSRLDAQRHTYLDYCGSALYGESQIDAHWKHLRAGVYGNPHSDSLPSRASTEVIEAARRLVLEFLDVDPSTHDVCFTANASAAIKLVAERYSFTPESVLVLAADNHNSVNGVREYAKRAGARVRYLPLDAELRFCGAVEALESEAMGGGGLLAFPAQSNFSGVRHSLALVSQAKALGWDVLVDVAAFAPSHPLSLRRCPADFAALSFYKLFGYPTGLGALVARKDALVRLHRPWFAGGAVAYASVDGGVYRHLHGAEGFEDGTPDFLSLAALPAGFALLTEVGMPALSTHVAALTQMFLQELLALRHGNGVPLARIYGPSDTSARGSTIAFNVCDRLGDPYPYNEVESEARKAGVSIRGGCFCNPGAAEAAFGLSGARLTGCQDALADDFTPARFGACAGAAVGAVRVSIGLANNRDDIRRVIDVLAAFRDPLHF